VAFEILPAWFSTSFAAGMAAGALEIAVRS
jgi:hypothetical protein